MYITLALCAGVLIGVLTTILILGHSSAGLLHIVTDKQDGGSYMFLELSEDVSKVASKKYVTFKTTQK